MYNQLMYEHLLNKYGVEKTIDFCLLNSEATQHLYNFIDDDGSVDHETYMEYAYDAKWWKEKHDILLKERNDRLINSNSGRKIY